MEYWITSGQSFGPKSGPDANTRFAALAFVSGALWLAVALVTSGEPEHWSPSSLLDYSAVALFSSAMLSLGVCVGSFNVGRTTVAPIALRVAALSALVVGIADFAEDWLRISSFGTAFVTGVIVLSVALLVLSVALALTRGRRALALPILATLLGVLLLSSVYGGVLLSAAWLATGALALSGARPFLSDPR